MRNWDLTSGGAKLETAMQQLRKARDELLAQWDDQACRDFQEQFLAPLDARVRRLLEVLHQFSEVVNTAQRECDVR